MLFNTTKSLFSAVVAGLILASVSAARCSMVSMREDSYGDFHLTFDKTTSKIVTTQSFSHYDHPELQDNLVNTYSIKQKINAVGKKNVVRIMNDVLGREVAHAASYYAFYHGCSIDFLLFQDVLKLLTQVFTKQSLQNFFLLRIPTKDFGRYASAQDFLTASNYVIDDSYGTARDMLLSVNPSFLGNNVNRETSSSFCYFLQSKTAFSIDSFNLIYDVFAHYNASQIYYKYAAELRELYRLLTAYEKAKTGILMQIFIPKSRVNTMIYRSHPRGVPYYGRYDYFATLPQDELEAYQQNLLPHGPSSGMLVDGMQFRILLSLNGMLQSANGGDPSSITMFRHFNQTATIKAYKAKAKALFQRIQKDLENR